MSKLLRVSVGTAAALNLLHCKLDAAPTTAYTMTYTTSRCSANCAFCAQARESTANANQLSRVTWPEYPLSHVIKALKDNVHGSSFKRICIQTLNFPSLVPELEHLIPIFRQQVPQIPLSIALPPLSKSHIQKFYKLGVDRVAISLDAVTPEIFSEIKGHGVNGPFSWKKHKQALKTCLSIFCKKRTTTHLIIGLGETEKESIALIQELTDQGITVSLFPFMPLNHTKLAKHDRPKISAYRRIQLAHYLIQKGLVHIDQMEFNSAENHLTKVKMPKRDLSKIVAQAKAFQTAGCPSCNRPFFTEQPRGPIYNYPVSPLPQAIGKIRNQLGGIL
ncbi:MAG: radical SAM protein [Candidatus Thorarchaeota archaeon]